MFPAVLKKLFNYRGQKFIHNAQKNSMIKVGNKNHEKFVTLS